MGFDVIYLPPIHPIGRVNRKGRNNTLDPATRRPRLAVGDRLGPRAATTRSTPTSARSTTSTRSSRGPGELGLEVALDLALQAAPTTRGSPTHPEWFTTRADGTIAYAENPPKKYQDIYPINFDNDPEGIYAEVLRIVRLWMSHGVRIFRVDNPHTKPVAVLGVAARRGPRDRPRRALPGRGVHQAGDDARLGTVGFHQSYTYFTWRTAKWELEEYFQEVAHETVPGAAPELLREHPRHPARLPAVRRPGGVQDPRRPRRDRVPDLGRLRRLRALRARRGASPAARSTSTRRSSRSGSATGTPPSAEGRTLAPYLTRLNEIRRAHPALQQLRNLTVHSSDDDSIVVYSKTEGDDTVIVVVNVDPHGTRETTVHLNMPALGLDWHDQFVVHDEITGESWTWGERNYVRLDPYVEPAHVLTVRRPHQ